MTFITTLIALLIERFFDCSHLRQWGWYAAYQRLVVQSAAGKMPYVGLAVTILPLLIIVFIVDILLSNVLYGFTQLIFELFIVLYCFGPQNLWADAFSSLNKVVSDEATVKKSVDATSIGYSQSLHRHFLSEVFIEANRRVFAVIFWYVILGPLGAVLYRTTVLSSVEAIEKDTSSSLLPAARQLLAVLDWLPVRALTFIFALGGHFVQVLACWRKYVLTGLSNNEVLLTECGAAALDNGEQGKTLESKVTERSAIGLLDRSFVITLVIIAIFVLLS